MASFVNGNAAVAQHGPKVFPLGTVFLHIGPHKTGTTALQNALFNERDTLLRHNVNYITTEDGRGNANLAARAIRNKPSQKHEAQVAVPMKYWNNIVRQASGSSADYSVISGEGFADCDDNEIHRIAKELAPGRLRIVVTLRPLAKILSSQWQQYIQNAMFKHDFGEWLGRTLSSFDHSPLSERKQPEGFWRRHGHDLLVKRWAFADTLKAPILIVADEGEPRAIMQGFEALTSLPEGTLQPGAVLTNRSLTLPEIEVVRSYYTRLYDQGFQQRVYRRGSAIRPGLIFKENRRPLLSEPRLEIPGQYSDEVVNLSSIIVDNLKQQKIHLFGDLNQLRLAPASNSSNNAAPLIPIDLAALLVVGMLERVGALRLSGNENINLSRWPLAKEAARKAAQYIPGGAKLLALLKRLASR